MEQNTNKWTNYEVQVLLSHNILHLVIVVSCAEVMLLYQPRASLCHFSVPIGGANANRKKALEGM